MGPDRFPTDLPEPLTDAVRRACTPPSPDFTKLDQEVLGLAAERLGRSRRFRIRLVMAGSGLAAAASVALVVWLATGRGSTATPGSEWILDSTRPITILDAFRLAKLLETGDPSISGSWDVTSDGVVDQKDVHELERRAVRLPGLASNTRTGYGEAAS